LEETASHPREEKRTPDSSVSAHKRDMSRVKDSRPRTNSL